MKECKIHSSLFLIKSFLICYQHKILRPLILKAWQVNAHASISQKEMSCCRAQMFTQLPASWYIQHPLSSTTHSEQTRCSNRQSFVENSETNETNVQKCSLNVSSCSILSFGYDIFESNIFMILKQINKK